MSQVLELNGFFRLLDIGIDELDLHSQSFSAMRRGELQGILVRNVYPPEALPPIIKKLEQYNPPFLKTWFPEAFNSWFYGQNLNLADPELGEYFEQAALFHQHLEQLFPQSALKHITGVLSALDNGRAFCPAPGPLPDQEYMFATIRAHEQGGFIPPHCENEYPRRRTYHHLRGIADAHVYSYVLALTLPESGGALEIFEHKMAIANTAETSTQQSETEIDIDQLKSVKIRIPPGSLMLFDSGAYLHQLQPIVSPQRRWTISSFMAMSKTEDKMYCWG